MNNITINDIYTGKPDAKDEITFDGIDNFIRSFVTPNNLDFNKLIDGNNCFITGYKGTGKTALLFYLDDLLKDKDNSCCTSFIFFKDEYTDTRKHNMRSLSKRILSSITIGDNTQVNNTDFEYIWRWLFLKRIVSDNQEYNNGLFVNDNKWNNFKNLVDIIKDPVNNKKTKIPSKIRLKFPLMKTECEVDFNKSKNDYSYLSFVELIDKAENAFGSLKRTDIPYYIFVDELEAYYGNEDIFYRDLYLIRDLLFTVKRFNEMFYRLSSKGLKIICSVRTEILRAISRFIVSKELNKITSGFSVAMQWNYSNTSSHLHPIIKVLLKRISISKNLNLDKDKDYLQIYQEWLPENIQGIEPANYILNNSWFKPRDIVRLLIAMQNSIANTKRKMTQEVFSYSQKQYSIESLEEIKEEMKALYNPREIDEIISCFNGFTTRFS
ncbi:MAG: hypothetical protein GX896_01725, partial [Clostridiales bacterium]|nr:hypothetical protein [Clostridiales bacterium]